MNETSSILVLCRDLLFVSKITATAQALDVPVKVVRDPAGLFAAQGKRLIVDLNQAGFLDAAAEWKARTRGHVTGFVAHTDEATIARASELGLDQVMTKGAFTARLEHVLQCT
jgi:hypothetical protein